MRTRRLGSTTFDVSPIGLGCMQFSGPGAIGKLLRPLDQSTVTSVVQAAMAGGTNWFDTAEMYGGGASERALTTALHDLEVPPGTVVVATKWLPWLRTAGNLRRTVDNRLAALQGYPVDLHQVHMPYGTLSTVSGQMRAMAELVREHRIAAVGVSNFSARQMLRADAVLRSYGLRLATNQVQISLLRRDVERNGVLAAARELGVTLIAYSPLRTGLLTGRFHEDPEQVRAVSRARRLALFSNRNLARTAPLVAELRAIGTAYGVCPAQVALAWVITYYGDTVVAIPGASRPGQAEQNAAAMDLRLTERELDRLAELSRG